MNVNHRSILMYYKATKEDMWINGNTPNSPCSHRNLDDEEVVTIVNVSSISPAWMQMPNDSQKWKKQIKKFQCNWYF